MSTITTINATDKPRLSREVINTNFANLNASKAEIADVALLAGAYANPSWIISLAWAKIAGAPATYAPSAHTHPFSEITGTIANAQVLSGAVTQHQAALALAASQITSGALALARGGTGADLSATGGANQVLKQTSAGGVVTVAALVAADIPSLDTAKITTGAFADARIAASNVTQHQAALSIASSQITGTFVGATKLSDYSTAFVTSITGTANQVTASASVGAVTLSLPQSIHTGATPTFAGLTSPSLTYAGTLALSATGANVITLSTNGITRVTYQSDGVAKHAKTAVIAFADDDGTPGPKISRAVDGMFLFNREIRITSDGSVGGVALFGWNGSTATDRAIATDITGDTSNRYSMDGNGKMWWGPGNASQDTTLYRNGVAALKTEGSIAVEGELIVNGASPVVTAPGTNAGLEIKNNGAGQILLKRTSGTGYLSLGINASGKSQISSFRSDSPYVGPLIINPDGGNLLLGTTIDDGSSKLQVSGNASIHAILKVGIPTANPGNGGSVHFRDDTGTARWLTGIGGSAGATSWLLCDLVNSKFAITVEANTASNTLYLNSSGNALIGGATNGNYRLDVQSSGSSGTLRVYDQTATTGVTSLVVRAGAGQSTTALLTLQENGGAMRGEWKVDSFSVGRNLSTETVNLYVGAGRSGSGFSIIDLIGDATYTTYGLRVMRSSGGANADAYVSNRGTGTLILQAEDAGAAEIKANGNSRFKANNTGIGFFGATPVAKQTATDLASVITLLQAYGLSN